MKDIILLVMKSVVLGSDRAVVYMESLASIPKRCVRLFNEET
jgi:hypothetical protein